MHACIFPSSPRDVHWATWKKKNTMGLERPLRSWSLHSNLTLRANPQECLKTRIFKNEDKLKFMEWYFLFTRQLYWYLVVKWKQCPPWLQAPPGPGWYLNLPFTSFPGSAPCRVHTQHTISAQWATPNRSLVTVPPVLQQTSFPNNPSSRLKLSMGGFFSSFLHNCFHLCLNFGHTSGLHITFHVFLKQLLSLSWWVFTHMLQKLCLWISSLVFGLVWPTAAKLSAHEDVCLAQQVQS